MNRDDVRPHDLISYEPLAHMLDAAVETAESLGHNVVCDSIGYRRSPASTPAVVGRY